MIMELLGYLLLEHFFLSDFHLTRFPVSFSPLFFLLFAQRLSWGEVVGCDEQMSENKVQAQI